MEIKYYLCGRCNNLVAGRIPPEDRFPDGCPGCGDGYGDWTEIRPDFECPDMEEYMAGRLGQDQAQMAIKKLLNSDMLNDYIMAVSVMEDLSQKIMEITGRTDVLICETVSVAKHLKKVAQPDPVEMLGALLALFNGLDDGPVDPLDDIWNQYNPPQIGAS